MKTYGTKRILPVYGDSRPVERRINNVKIAGWKEQSFNATLVSQTDTYNDSAFLKINGKSEQATSAQGKNLFDAYNYVTSYPDDIKPVNQDGEDWIKMQSSSKQARYNFNAKENTQYTFTFEFKRYDDSGSYSTNFVLYYTDGTSETLDFGYYGDGNLHKVSRKSAQNKTISYIRNANNGNTVYFLLRVNGSQIEEGITATAYSPFVPDSPSPDYPSPINSVSNFDLVSSDGIEQENIINFPYTLRSLPDGTKDYIEIDNVNKTAKLYKYVGEVIFNGTESWGKSSPTSTTVRYDISDYKIGDLLENVYCSHFKIISADSFNDKDARFDKKVGQSVSSGNYFIIRYSGYTDVGEDYILWKAWLAANPVTVQYKLATPTITNLEYEEVITYYPYTQIYTNATIQPALDGSLKIIDRS